MGEANGQVKLEGVDEMLQAPVPALGYAIGCNNDHGISPDSRRLPISSGHEKQGSKICIVPTEGGAARWVMKIWRMRMEGSNQEQVTDGPKLCGLVSAWSPDSKFIAFVTYRLVLP